MNRNVTVVVLAFLCFALVSPHLFAQSDRSVLRARPDYDWSFPTDHGAHPAYQTEWWYFSGIVSSDGREFGLQFTIFRQRTEQTPETGSDWFTNQVFMGHMAVSDLRNETHASAVQIARGHTELGTAPEKMPGTIRVRNWTCSFDEGWRIKADDGKLALSLDLKPTRPLLFQGPNGYSVKGPEEGQASMYYSQTRLKTSGTLTLDGTQHRVSGRTWFDHEFGSSQLSDDQVGWDWISLRLSDGSDLMVYRLREKDGSVSEQSSATLRRPDGSVSHIPQEQWSMTPLAHWTSPLTGGRYPVRWRVQLENPDTELVVNRRFDAQEMVLPGGLTAPYWEGVISAEGQLDDTSVTGSGFLEMTGYVESLEGAF